MWEYVLGGATVFGLIVAVGTWFNGRVTRREISRLIVEEHRTTREEISKLIVEELKATRELIAKMDERIARVDERMAKADERFESLLRAIEAHSRASTQQHEEILNWVKQLSRE
ncbi:MAG: hypothetical protein N3H31_06545 [Candidatus Nezhaarchaeota archaeon]|nr:hypothetical protein [Candidatus Nezhaarchaeota archaeon]